LALAEGLNVSEGNSRPTFFGVTKAGRQQLVLIPKAAILRDDEGISKEGGVAGDVHRRPSHKSSCLTANTEATQCFDAIELALLIPALRWKRDALNFKQVEERIDLSILLTNSVAELVQSALNFA
jgi:hypothetical protein